MHPSKTITRSDGPRLLTSAAGQRRSASRLQKVRDAYEAVCASNGAAAEAGDNSVWHDNFDYEENQRQMHQLARRFRDLEDALRRMVVVPAPRDPAQVCFGCAVTVETEDGRIERLVIGGYDDGDADLHRIAYTTPLAQALLRAEPGDVRTFTAGGRERELTVIAIEAAHAEEL